MYSGGMAKLGRGGGGGGRGGGKRSLPPPAPPAHVQRVGPSAAAGRVPLGNTASRGRHGATAGPSGGPGAAASEETFSMVSRDVLDFAAIIRLTPDLVDEIRRLEAQGGAAKIKFDSNSNNLSGNVIDVGGKEFKFTWSRELGVCDIYEELQNGDDGNGLLSECGSAWRKLNVQRILDESLKNHVKMRSEEAERRHKSRKSIVLDPANPSVKNQAKTMAAAAVEGNMRRMHWKKDQLFKKRKSEPGMAPSTIVRSAFKPGPPSNNSTATMLSVSPQPSPPEQAGVGASVSPFGMANLPRGHAAMEEDLAPLTSNGEDAINSEKELSNKPAHGATRRLVVNKGASSSQPVDLRSLLVNLLLETPKGLSLKALEKAVAEVIPNPGKKIDSIIKAVATYQAPGRYILKPGIEVECSRRTPCESGSSPDHPVGSLPVTKVLEKDNTEDSENKTQLIPKPVEDIIEKIDIEQNSPDQPTADMKVDKEDEGACSSSESGSDSDSESDSSDSGSDSGSQSRSRSKSQSPVGSGSASSSDSESDGSSSSKEGSDVDVDIMTSDDDKEETGNKLPTSSRLSPSPRERKAYDEKHEENAIGRGNINFQRASPPKDSHVYGRGDGGHAVEDTEGRSKEARIKTSENFETATTKSGVSADFQMNVQVLSQGMPSQDQHDQPVLQSMSSAGNSTVDKSEPVLTHSSINKQFIRKKGPDLEQSDGIKTISKAKPKRPSDSKHSQEKPENSKRPRAANTGVQVASGKSRNNSFPEKSCVISPERSETWQRRVQMMQTTSDIEQERSTFDSQKDPDSAPAGRYMVHENADQSRLNPDLQNVNGTTYDAQHLGHRAGDSIVRGRAFDGVEKSGRHVDNSRAGRHPEKLHGRPDGLDTSGTRNVSSQDKFFVSRGKPYKDVRDANMDVNEKYSAKNLLDDTGGDKLSSFPDSHYRRSSDQNGIQKDVKLSVSVQKTDVDKYAGTSEKGVLLRREISDLELGEFREPLPIEDTKEDRRQFERKSSFKSSDSKFGMMDNISSDSNKGRTPAKAAHEPRRESPYMSQCGSQANQDVSYRRMSEGDVIMDSTISQQRTISSQVQQFSRVDLPEHDPVSHLDRLSDMAGRSDTRTSQGNGQENHVFSHKRTSASVLPQHDTKHSGHNNHMASKAALDTKPQKFNGPSNASDQSKEGFQMQNIMNSGKRMDSSSDEDDSFYAKYDKNEPELRGPIKDWSECKEYVQEFHEKYECYLSLHRQLEKYRSEFSKVGRGLGQYKGRDKEAYHNIAEEILRMYHQCKKKHFRMKKLFIVLHEELKMLKQRIQEYREY